MFEDKNFVIILLALGILLVKIITHGLDLSIFILFQCFAEEINGLVSI